MMRCPCCGQQFTGVVPKVSLEFNTFFAGERCVEMPPTPAEIVHTILTVAPAPMPRARLIQRVIPVSSRAKDADGQIRTQVYLARKALEKIGWTIKHESLRGYRVIAL